MFEGMQLSLNYQIILLLVVGVFYLFIQNIEKEKYIVIWGACWGLDLLRYVLEYMIEYKIIKNVTLPQLIIFILLTISSIMFTYGFYLFFKKKISNKNMLLFSLLIIWYLLGKLLGYRNYIDTFPMYFYLGFISIITGILILKEVTFSKVISRFIIGILLIILGTRELTYPIVKHFDLTMYIIDFDLLYSLKLIIIIVLLLQFYEEARSKLLISDEKQKEFIKSLHEEKEWLKVTLRSIGDAVIATDKAGNIKFINPTAERLMGYKEKEVLGEKIEKVFNIINEDTKKKAEIPIEKVLKTGEIQGLANHTSLITKDGNEIAIADSASPIKDIDNKIIGTVMVFRDVSDKRQYEKLLKHYEFIVNSSNEGIGSFSIDGIIQTWNSGCERIYGYKAEEIIGKSIYDTVIPDFEKEKIKEILEKLLKGQNVKSYEGIRRKKDGSFFNVLVSIAVLKDSNGKFLGISFVSHDITERTRAEQILIRYKLLFDNINDIILFAEFEDGKIIEANKAALNAYGYSLDELLNMNIFELCDCKRDFLEHRIFETADSAGLIEMKHLRKDKSSFYVEVNAVNVEFQNQRYILAVIRDITERKIAQERIEHLGTHDILTGLYNRNFFEEYMLLIEDKGIVPTGIIMCDVDGLKIVNDTMGHKAGDELLKAAADILTYSLRSKDIIARIGGDEFAVILPDTDLNLVSSIAERIKKAVYDSKFKYENFNIALSFSVGYAVKTNNYITLEEVLKKADENMYKEKLFNKSNTYRKVLNSILKIFEYKQPFLKVHGQKVTKLIFDVAECLNISKSRLKNLELLAEFHDIGMIGIPHDIITKNEDLSENEKDELKRHTEIGYRLALSSQDLAHIADMILMHHEWWNGGGYPLGVKGEDIPFESRLLSLADAYITMTEENNLSKEEAFDEIKKLSGVKFDPILTEKFLECLMKT